jgi:hypothetical protein
MVMGGVLLLFLSSSFLLSFSPLLLLCSCFLNNGNEGIERIG